jgi:hypothetical protein
MTAVDLCLEPLGLLLIIVESVRADRPEELE